MRRATRRPLRTVIFAGKARTIRRKRDAVIRVDPGAADGPVDECPAALGRGSNVAPKIVLRLALTIRVTSRYPS